VTVATTSRIPAAVDALVALWKAAPGLAGVSVLDGPPTVDQSDADYLYVGYQFGGDAAVEMSQDFASAGARRRDETFDVLCQVDSFTGDTDTSARRGRAFELLAAVEDSLRATAAAPTAPTLGGAVLWAHLTQAQLVQRFTDQGVQVGVAFRVSCHARI
jgi:hypothetical protein